ncbi:leucine-rich repeat protein [Perkinsela sp. CCAP 1560/4]|nr:leucine-rich repeat protein [Perkinsela sp. CCAP 1560/4]|eukprot:KNH04131.1 leucine-rich repeat protein [Perkinsela sp. CCAP 1560/4]
MFTIHTADLLCGRCSIEDLPHQSLMELLIVEIPDSSKVYEGDKMTGDDCCTWKGVFCKDGMVQRISWGFQFSPASVQINLCYVPASVTELTMHANYFCGKLEINALPRELRQLNLSINQFHGSISLVELPPNIMVVSIRKNDLSGSIDLRVLPPTMQSLSLEHNKLSGTIDLSNLPEGLLVLSLSDNCFGGPINMTKLPSTLSSMNLSSNKLTGEVKLRSMPIGLDVLSLQSNHLEGEVDLRYLPKDMDGMIHLSYNRLTGTVRMTRGMLMNVWLLGNQITEVCDENEKPLLSLNIHLTYSEI